MFDIGRPLTKETTEIRWVCIKELNENGWSRRKLT